MSQLFIFFIVFGVFLTFVFRRARVVFFLLDELCRGRVFVRAVFIVCFLLLLCPSCYGNSIGFTFDNLFSLPCVVRFFFNIGKSGRTGGETSSQLSLPFFFEKKIVC